MLNIRTILSSVIVVIVLLLTVQLVNARTGVASDPWSAPSIGLGHQERYDQMNKAPIPAYRSPLDECFDVSISESASCYDASQQPALSNQPALDTCSDVGLIYRAECLKEVQEPTP
jgi:hypothetical protein